MLTQFWRLIARWKALKKTLLPIYGFPIIKLSDHTLIFDWTLICAKYQLVCRVEKVKSGANSLGMSSTVQIIWREGAFLLFFYPPFLFLDPPTPFSIHSISTVGINMIQIHDFFMNSLACAFHSFFRNRGVSTSLKWKLAGHFSNTFDFVRRKLVKVRPTSDRSRKMGP